MFSNITLATGNFTTFLFLHFSPYFYGGFLQLLRQRENGDERVIGKHIDHAVIDAHIVGGFVLEIEHIEVAFELAGGVTVRDSALQGLGSFLRDKAFGKARALFEAVNRMVRNV